MTKTVRARYTLEFKQEKVVSAEQMQISRLRAQLARDILGKATAYFARAHS